MCVIWFPTRPGSQERSPKLRVSIARLVYSVLQIFTPYILAAGQGTKLLAASCRSVYETFKIFKKHSDVYITRLTTFDGHKITHPSGIRTTLSKILSKLDTLLHEINDHPPTCANVWSRRSDTVVVKVVVHKLYDK